MKRILMVTIALVLLTGSARDASAVPELLRPGTKPMWAGAALGPAIKVSDSITQFKLLQTFGYHFSGNGAGPAIAVDLQESFGDNHIIFNIMPKFVWDIPIIEGMGFYISPSAGLGFSLFAIEEVCVWNKCAGGDSYPGLTVQLAVQGKLILGDFGYVFFRPIGIDISAWNYCVNTGYGEVCDMTDASVRWDMMFGGGVTF